LISYVSGGDVSQTTALLGRGLTTDTVDRLQTFILPGVKEDAPKRHSNKQSTAIILIILLLVQMN
jgi:hypothetical protein